MLTIKTKYFNELTRGELYTLLQLRSEIFVVEQKCVYQDIDGKDERALHVMGFKNGNLVAYARVFKPGDYFPEPKVRVSVFPVLIQWPSVLIRFFGLFSCRF